MSDDALFSSVMRNLGGATPGGPASSTSAPEPDDELYRRALGTVNGSPVDQDEGLFHKVMGGLEAVLGAPRRAVMAGGRAVGRLEGLDIPESMSPGQVVREAAGLSTDPAVGQQGNDTYGRRIAGGLTQLGGDVGADPTTYLLGGAGKLAGLGKTATAALEAGGRLAPEALGALAPEAAAAAQGVASSGRIAHAVGRGAAAAFAPGMAISSVNAAQDLYHRLLTEGMTPAAAEDAVNAATSGAFAVGTAGHALGLGGGRRIAAPEAAAGVPAEPGFVAPEQPFELPADRAFGVEPVQPQAATFGLSPEAAAYRPPGPPVDVLAEREFLTPDREAQVNAEQAARGRQFVGDQGITADALNEALQRPPGPPRLAPPTGGFPEGPPLRRTPVESPPAGEAPPFHVPTADDALEASIIKSLSARPEAPRLVPTAVQARDAAELGRVAPRLADIPDAELAGRERYYRREGLQQTGDAVREEITKRAEATASNTQGSAAPQVSAPGPAPAIQPAAPAPEQPITERAEGALSRNAAAPIPAAPAPPAPEQPTTEVAAPGPTEPLPDFRTWAQANGYAFTGDRNMALAAQRAYLEAFPEADREQFRPGAAGGPVSAPFRDEPRPPNVEGEAAAQAEKGSALRELPRDMVDKSLRESADLLETTNLTRHPELIADLGLEGIADKPKLVSAIRQDADNPIYLKALEQHAERIADNTERGGGVVEDRKPAYGQRGLPGIAEDVAPRPAETTVPRQESLFGGSEMLQPTEAKTTEGREEAGPLFTQEADAAARTETAGQGDLFAREPEARYLPSGETYQAAPDRVAAKREAYDAARQLGLDFGRPERGAPVSAAGTPTGRPLRGIDAGSGVRTVSLAVTIPKELKERGRVDLRGQRATSPTDLAVLANVYRDPRYETFRIFYTKGDEIVAHEALSSRIPDAVQVLDAPAKNLHEMRERMRRTKADGYWILHNHPSGEPHASEPDIRVTAKYADAVPGLKGHVIINGKTFGYIDPQMAQLSRYSGAMRSEILPLPKALRSVEPYLVPSLGADTPHSIGSPADLANVGAKLRSGAPEDYVTLIHTATSTGVVRAVQEMPAALFARPEAADYIRGQQRSVGAGRTFAYHPGGPDVRIETGARLVREGVLTDSVIDSRSAAKLGVTPAVTSLAGKTFKRMSVAESAPKYEPDFASTEEPFKPEEREFKIGSTSPGGRPPTPDEAPQVEHRVEGLRGAEQAAGVEPMDLARDSPRTWESLDPKIQRVLRDTPEETLRKRAENGNLDDVGTQAWAAVVQGKRESMERARAAVENAKAGLEDSGIANANYLGATLDYVAAEGAHIKGGTITARALAARARIMNAGANVPQAFLKRVFREIEGVSDKQAAELLRVFTEDPASLPDTLRATIKPSMLDKFLEFWKAGLVSAPGTQLANVAGNAIEQTAWLGETLTAAAIDKMVPGERARGGGEARAELAGAGTQLREATRRFWDEAKSAFTLGPEQFDLTKGRLEGQIGAIAGKKGRAVRIPFRMLQAADSWFAQVASGAELGKRAYRRAAQELGASAAGDAIERRAAEIRANPSKALLDEVQKASLARTFHDEPGTLAKSILSARRQNRLLNLVVPFVNTPASIARRTIQRSPIGFLLNDARKAYGDFLRAQGEFQGGKIGRDAYLDAKGAAIDALARPALGTAILGSFAALAQSGGMTGSGPTDPKERNLLRETGWQPYSFVVNVGGKKNYIPFNRFEPVSSTLGFAADMVEARDSKKAGDFLDKTIGSITQNLTSKTYLQGLADAGALIANPAQAASQYVSGLAGSLVPNIVAKAEQAYDPTLRDVSPSTAGIAGAPEKLAKTVAARVPGLAEMLPAKKSSTGEDIERPGNALTRFALPVQPSQEKEGTEVESLLVNLGYAPSQPTKDFTIPGSNGKKLHLEPEEYSLMQQANKRAADYIRQNFVGNRRFSALDPEEQKKAVERVYDQARDSQRRQLYAQPSFRSRASALLGAR